MSQQPNMQLFLLLTLAAAATSLAAALDCPDDFVAVDEKCILFPEKRKNYYMAADHCESLGTKLTAPRTRLEYDELKDLGQVKNYDFWLGITDLKQEGRWEWSTIRMLAHSS